MTWTVADHLGGTPRHPADYRKRKERCGLGRIAWLSAARGWYAGYEPIEADAEFIGEAPEIVVAAPLIGDRAELE
jgi:hypothetical protein